MTDPTPTRDEAVPTGWKLVPIEPTPEMIQAACDATFGPTPSTPEQAHRAGYHAMLASAPAPASGGVDAVALLRDVANSHTQYCETLHRAADIITSLSTAATPVSEGDMRAFGASEHAAYKWPDDTPEHRAARAAFCEGAALAKPASSPAPVRPIGNQGISDYQREIARNMAEGFAAWNAARQEALPSDEPASSPAGGDVVREALEDARGWIELAEDLGRDNSKALALNEKALAALPALPTDGGVEAGIYIASKTTHGARWRGLRASGVPITSTWIDEAEAGATSNWHDLWHRCVQEASQAAVTIVYREEGEVLKGAFVEMGAALAAGRIVFAVGCDEFSVRHHMRVVPCSTLEEALELAHEHIAALSQSTSAGRVGE